jgi:hypothetical protein
MMNIRELREEFSGTLHSCVYPVIVLVHANYTFFYSSDVFAIYLNYVRKLGSPTTTSCVSSSQRSSPPSAKATMTCLIGSSSTMALAHSPTQRRSSSSTGWRSHQYTMTAVHAFVMGIGRTMP